LYDKIDALSRSNSDISVIVILLCNFNPVISAIANENQLTVTSLHSPSSATPDDVPTLKEICATGEFCAPTRRCCFIERIQENCCIVKLMRCPRATVTVTSLQFVSCSAIFILLSLQSPTKIN